VPFGILSFGTLSIDRRLEKLRIRRTIEEQEARSIPHGLSLRLFCGFSTRPKVVPFYKACCASSHSAAGYGILKRLQLDEAAVVAPRVLEQDCRQGQFY